MFGRIATLILTLLLAACQTTQLERDFDPTRDFAGYRSWSWQSPRLQYRPDDPRLKSDLTEQRITEAVAEQLDQRGLRPAPGNSAGDLKVQAWLVVDDRQREIRTGYSPTWGGYWGNYWGGPMMMETRTIEYQVATLQIDLFDATDGKLVWRGSAAQVMQNDPPSPQERAQSIRETVAKVMSQYPPR